MGLSSKDLTDLGVKRIDPFVPVPADWNQKGFREVKGKKDGKVHTVLVFERPNEPEIELWGHSLDCRDGRFFVKSDHLARQVEIARKGN